jgi:5'-nucleotidase
MERLRDRDTQEPILAPYEIWKVRGVEVGVIGVVLDETPSIVSAAGIADVQFLDEVETINRYAAELREQGVETIVVSLHEGGSAGSDVNGCSNPIGPAFDITRAIDDSVDVVMSGIRPLPRRLRVRGRREAGHPGLVQRPADHRHRPSIDRRTGDVVAQSAENVIVTGPASTSPGRS